MKPLKNFEMFLLKFSNLAFCFLQVHLDSLLLLDVTVTNLGFKGDLLLARFMSTEKGFRTLFESGVVALEFSKWNKVC